MFPNQQFNYAQQAQQAAAMWSQYNNYWQQVASMNQNTMQQQQASYNQNIQSQVYNYNFVYYNSIVWSVCVCVCYLPKWEIKWRMKSTRPEVSY